MDPVVCIKRSADSATLEVAHPDLRPPPWVVEKYQGNGWFGDPIWASVPPDQCTASSASSSDAPEPAEPLYHLVLTSLKPETTYKFRIVQGEPDHPCELECKFETAHRPPVLEPVQCLARRADALSIVWPVPLLEAPALESQVQYRLADKFFGGWQDQSFSQQDGLDWRGDLKNLQGNTEYLVRVKARNCIGWSREFSEPTRMRTSDRPPAPQHVRMIARHPHAVTLQFTVEDVEGAATLGVDAELCGALQWHQALHTVKEFTQVASRSSSDCPTQSGTIIVNELPHEVDSEIRLWAFNAVGKSSVPSATVKCRPSSRPRVISDLRSIGRHVNAIELEWSTKDSEGAPVTHSVLEVCRDHVLGSYAQVPQSAITRTPHPNSRTRSKWRARIENLSPETSYLVRAFSQNAVGRSDAAIPLECRTADRPPAPHSIICIKRELKSVTLEYDLHCDAVQKQCVDPVVSVHVECAGALAWQSLPADSILDAEVSSCRRPPASDNTIRRAIQLTNLDPGTWYTLRIWVANDVGWNQEFPPSIECHTSTRPEVPTHLEADATSPHSFHCTWLVGDPEGAPVLGAEVQIRENSVFSAWRAPLGEETIEHHPGSESPSELPSKWARILDGLRPGVDHILRLRARNAVDWSDWSPELPCRAPVAPGRAFLESSSSPFDADNNPLLFLEFSINDPVGAPVISCIVSASKSGDQAVAVRCDGGTSWRACITGEAAKEKTFKVRAANVVGWSPASDMQMKTGSNQHNPFTSECPVQFPISGEVSSFICMQMTERQRTHAHLKELCDDATAHDRIDCLDASHPQKRMLVTRMQPVALSLDVLKVICKLSTGGLEHEEFRTWAERGRACQDQLSELSKFESETEIVHHRALEAFQVLVEAGVWIEQLASECLGPMQQLLWKAEEKPESARVVRIWAQQTKAWSEHFQRQFLEVWREAFYTASRVLAAIGNNGDVVAACEHAKRDLVALLALREAAEQQEQKLNRVTALMGSVGDTSKAFDQVSISDKVSQSAMALLLGATLWIPGSMEFGVVSVGTIWMDGDIAGKHMSVEHAKSDGPEAPLQRFRQRGKPETVKRLQSWVNGEHDDAVLVHNATPRVITVRLVDSVTGVMKKTYQNLKDSHPYAYILTKGVDAVAGGEEGSPVCTIEPTNVAVVPVPLVPTWGDDSEKPPFDLEFAYGKDEHVERPIGRAPAKAGSAVGFVCLDREVHINNQSAVCREEHASRAAVEGVTNGYAMQTAADAAAAEPAPKSSAIKGTASTDMDNDAQHAALPMQAVCSSPRWWNDDRFIEVINSDITAVTMDFYRGARGFFHKPINSFKLEPGEQHSISLQQLSPEVSSSSAANVETTANEPKCNSEDDILFYIEVQGSAGKSLCNARLGQVITYEGVL